nr:hypothetical protein [Tanacetum cinerariifolium]
MEAGGNDRPPMLTPGNYIQWKSRIKRYIDTKPNHELIHHCHENPPYEYKWIPNPTPDTPDTDGGNQTGPKESKKAMIDNDIYSTADACPNAMEMWKAVKRLKQELHQTQDVDNTPRTNKGYRHVARERKKAKRPKDSTYHKEKMLLCKKEEAGIHLSTEQADWRDNSNDEPEDQELEAHYMYMAKVQEVIQENADNFRRIFDTGPFEKSRSVPAGFTRSVPAGFTRSVPAGFTRSVPAGFTRSVPTGFTRSVPAGFTRSVPAGFTRSVPAGFTRSVPVGFTRLVPAGFTRSVPTGFTRSVPNNLLDRTMATTIEQQVALDEALVPSAQRLRIGRSNFRLPSDIQSKESTLQVVYDVLRRSPFFKAFLVTADVEMLHISPRVSGQSFAELPFEEEILEFRWFLGHSAEIKTLTDVNVGIC